MKALKRSWKDVLKDLKRNRKDAVNKFSWGAFFIQFFVLSLFLHGSLLRVFFHECAGHTLNKSANILLGLTPRSNVLIFLLVAIFDF